MLSDDPEIRKEQLKAIFAKGWYGRRSGRNTHGAYRSRRKHSSYSSVENIVDTQSQTNSSSNAHNTNTAPTSSTVANVPKDVSEFIAKPIQREIVHYTALAFLSAAAPPFVPVAEVTYNLLTYGKPAYTIVSKALELHEGEGDRVSDIESVAVATADLTMSKSVNDATGYTINMINARMGISNYASGVILDKLVFEPTVSNAFSYGVDVVTQEGVRHMLSVMVNLAG